MDTPEYADLQKLTFIHSVFTKKNGSLIRIERERDRELGESILSVRLDNDDDEIVDGDQSLMVALAINLQSPGTEDMVSIRP